MSGHQSVLLHEAVEFLVTDRSGFYLDGTFGRGGHSRLILQNLDPEARLMIIDKDPQAIASAKQLQANDDRVLVRNGSFADLGDFINEVSMVGKVSGILLDLGVSSPQLDDPERGFSFSKDGPLDMRMNNSSGVSARDWVASASEEEIIRVLLEFGEEKFARRMARAICEERVRTPILTTAHLARVIAEANPAWEKHKHPATRAFQAIRIKINNELDDLGKGLEISLDMLKVGGRLVVISFHSLEDRIVKRFFQKQCRGDDFPADLPVMHSQLNPRVRSIGKAVKVGSRELSENPRARSAVMRVVEKIA